MTDKRIQQILEHFGVYKDRQLPSKTIKREYVSPRDDAAVALELYRKVSWAEYSGGGDGGIAVWFDADDKNWVWSRMTFPRTSGWTGKFASFADALLDAADQFVPVTTRADEPDAETTNS